MKDNSLDDLYIYTYAEKMFEILAGARSYDFITNQQFQKLARYPGMTNNLIVKGHYDIIYKSVIKRSDNSQMDLNCFFEALEELANRLFDHENPFDNLNKFTFERDRSLNSPPSLTGSLRFSLTCVIN